MTCYATCYDLYRIKCSDSVNGQSIIKGVKMSRGQIILSLALKKKIINHGDDFIDVQNTACKRELFPPEQPSVTSHGK